MRQAAKKAKAAGEEVKCTSCHVDQKSFELEEGAVDKLRTWL
jgi:hypothetical protein